VFVKLWKPIFKEEEESEEEERKPEIEFQGMEKRKKIARQFVAPFQLSPFLSVERSIRFFM
jgi:hypothetical protein